MKDAYYSLFPAVAEEQDRLLMIFLQNIVPSFIDSLVSLKIIIILITDTTFLQD
jgi:hypothetical protein